MDERIKEHLKHLNRYFLLLSELKKKTYDEYEEDFILQGSSERFLQLAIESCLNIGNRLLSIHQFKRPTETPETYADIFIQLKKMGVIDSDFSNRLVKMAKFRNRLVHLYWELDKKKVYQIIHDHIDDFKLFQDQVVKFLNAQKEQ